MVPAIAHGIQAVVTLSLRQQPLLQGETSRSSASCRLTAIYTNSRERKDFDCNVDVAIDRELEQRNAYFTYKNDKPAIRISLPMLQDTASDDEVAFTPAAEVRSPPELGLRLGLRHQLSNLLHAQNPSSGSNVLIENEAGRGHDPITCNGDDVGDFFDLKVDPGGFRGSSRIICQGHTFLAA